ncbi:MAG: hypothetical protein AAFY88_16220 [Acidobacteriota bacterium]
MKSTHVLLLSLLAAVGIWWMLTSPGEGDAAIRARLDIVEQLLVKEADEKALESADRARRMAELLAPSFVLYLDPIHQEIRDPAALARPFVGFRQGVERLEVDFHGVEIDVDPDAGRATSTMVVSLRSNGAAGGRSAGADGRRGAYDASIRWLRNGDWLIEELKAVEISGGVPLFD